MVVCIDGIARGGGGSMVKNLRYTRRICRTLAGAWLCAAIALCGVPLARAEPVAVGDLPALTGNDGYLLVVVDTNRTIQRLRIKRRSGVGIGPVLSDLSNARSLHVLRLAAGEYEWHRVETRGGYLPSGDNVTVGQLIAGGIDLRYDLAGAPVSGPLTVQAGAMTYAGDLRLRFGSTGLDVERPNRLAQAATLLADHHPNADEWMVQFAGASPDPYPAWLGVPAASVLAPDPESCPEPSQLPQGRPDAEKLFLAEAVSSLTLSPEADLLVEAAYRNRNYVLSVIDPASGQVLELFSSARAIRDVAWAGRRRLVATFDGGFRAVQVIDLGEWPSGRGEFTKTAVPVDGWLVDALPRDDESVLFARFQRSSGDNVQVFRVNIAGKGISTAQFQARHRLDRGVSNGRHWLADPSGQLRVAVTEGQEHRQVLYRPQGRSAYRPLLTIRSTEVFAPMAVATDGRLLALSNQNREQVELVRIDPDQPGASETVFSLPGIDMSGVVTANATGEVLGVRYYEQGRARVHYMDSRHQEWQGALEGAFPGQMVEVVDADPDREVAVVRVSDDVTPATYYRFDVAGSKAEELAQGAPWLAGFDFVRRRVFEVPGEQGGRLQALLAVPDGSGPHPLLVMPHGGPLFVQDTLRFDRDVQYWATRGFAVLQVNFRGSYGFGVQHLLAGFSGFGRQIEDDIEHALDAALAREPRLDDSRVCAIGASYGGYSSLMLAVRSERIRCAVSIAGPTDLPLLFTSSDWILRPASMAMMKRVVGDPASVGLRMHSPLYRADELEVPVLLIHGGEDRRVDYEHSARMAQALDLRRKPFRLLRIDGMGHAPETVAERACIMGSAELFLREQLAP